MHQRRAEACLLLPHLGEDLAKQSQLLAIRRPVTVALRLEGPVIVPTRLVRQARERIGGAGRRLPDGGYRIRQAVGGSPGANQ